MLSKFLTYGRRLHCDKRLSSMFGRSFASSLTGKHFGKPGEIIKLNNEYVKLPENLSGSRRDIAFSAYGIEAVETQLHSKAIEEQLDPLVVETYRFNIHLYLNVRPLLVAYFEGSWVACHFDHGFKCFDSEDEADAHAMSIGGVGWFVTCIGREIVEVVKIGLVAQAANDNDLLFPEVNAVRSPGGVYYNNGIYDNVKLIYNDGSWSTEVMQINSGCCETVLKQYIINDCTKNKGYNPKFKNVKGFDGVLRETTGITMLFEWRGLKTRCTAFTGTNLLGMAVLERYRLTLNIKAKGICDAVIQEGETDEAYLSAE